MRLPVLSAPASSVGNGRCIHPPSQRRSGRGVCPSVKPDSCLYGDIPAFREHPRIPVADTEAIGIALIAFCPASKVITGIGKMLTDKMPDEGFVEPVAGAELHGMEVHRKGCGLHRIPVAGQLQRPVVRQGRFDPDVQRPAACRKSVGPYGEDLRRSPAGQPPQGRRQQHEQYDSLFVHC